MKHIKSVIIIYLLTACTSIFSQEIDTNFNFVNIKESVSKIGVSTIIQDHYGFIWMGTNGVGLNRFDGIDYVTYKHALKDSTSISSSLIHASYLDKQNRLWFGTEEGVSLYNRDLDYFKRIPVYDKNSNNKQNFSIRSLQGDNQNNLFIGTFGAGMFKLNLDDFSLEKIFNAVSIDDSFLTITSIKSNSKGDILVATNRGLLIYDALLNK